MKLPCPRFLPAVATPSPIAFIGFLFIPPAALWTISIPRCKLDAPGLGGFLYPNPDDLVIPGPSTSWFHINHAPPEGGGILPAGIAPGVFSPPASLTPYIMVPSNTDTSPLFWPSYIGWFTSLPYGPCKYPNRFSNCLSIFGFSISHTALIFAGSNLAVSITKGIVDKNLQASLSPELFNPLNISPINKSGAASPETTILVEYCSMRLLSFSISLLVISWVYLLNGASVTAPV